MSSRAPFVILLAALLGCDPGEFKLIEPQSGNGGPRSSLTLANRVVVDRSDANLASALGWTGGVPGAQFHYTRVDQREYHWKTLSVDASGQLILPNLEPGIYWVAAEKELSASETAAVGNRTRFFGAGEKLFARVTDTMRASVPVQSERSASLVISEAYLSEPPPWVVTTYGESKYLELFNNADRVVYLDGMILGKAYEWWLEHGRFGHHSCAVTEPMRNDSTGIWSDMAWRFPGTGANHPVPPGATILVAVSALDHRSRHSSFLNLSNAAFEFTARGQADNPAVPNLVPVGTRSPEPQDFLPNRGMWFLASPVAVESLPLAKDPGGSQYLVKEYRKFPREKIVDAALIWWDWTGAYSTTGPIDPCKDPIHPVFDRSPGGFLKTDDLELSAQRRRLLASGRLLDTNTSRVDFQKAKRTPGSINN